MNVELMNTLLESNWGVEPFENNDVDGFDFDSMEAFFESVSELPNAIPDTVPSPTFKAFVARYGFTDLVDWNRMLNLFILQLNPSPSFDPFKNSYYPAELKPTLNGKKATVFHWVDNPGDAYSFEFALTDPDLHPFSELWLYRGHDLAWQDGIQIAPLATSFWNLAAIVVSGLGDALFTPSNEKSAAFEKLKPESFELHLSLLDSLGELINDTRSLEFKCEHVDSWEGEITKLEQRISEIRKVVS